MGTSKARSPCNAARYSLDTKAVPPQPSETLCPPQPNQNSPSQSAHDVVDIDQGSRGVIGSLRDCMAVISHIKDRTRHSDKRK